MIKSAIIAAPAAALIAITGCAAVQAAPVPEAAPASTVAQANAHARAVMARCVREHPPVSLAALQAQVTCAVPLAYRKAAGQCITAGVTGARDAFTRRRQIAEVFAEECMASGR